MIKTVFCDLGNVLVKVDRPKAFQLLSEYLGLPPEILVAPAAQALELGFERGELSEAEYLTRVKTFLPSKNHITIAGLVELWQTPFEYDWSVWELIQQVRLKVPVILLSNTNPLHIRAIRQKFDLFAYLDGWVLSYEVRALKPEAAIYQTALNKVGCQPAEALLIDDLPENVSGAQDVGMQAYQFVEIGALKQFLCQLNLI